MAEHESTSKLTLSQVWQLPVLLLATILLALGWYLALPEPPQRDLDGEMAAVESFIEAGQYEKAIPGLDELLQIYDALPDDLKIRYHLARGDAVGRGQKALGVDVEANHQVVVNQYRKAESLGYALDAKRVEWLSESLLALGRADEVDAVVDTAAVDDPVARQRLMRQALQSSIDQSGPTETTAAELLEFLNEDGLSRQNQLWAVARYTEFLLADDQPEEAANFVMRWLQRFDFAGSTDVGELMVLLARAQLAAGERRSAERWFIAARDQLDSSDPLNGDALTGLGQIRYEEGDVVEALEHFEDAVKLFEGTRSYLDALVGKAESESRLGSYGDSLASYDEAVDIALKGLGQRRLIDKVGQSLATQCDLRFAQGKFMLALKYLDLEERLYAPALPVKLLHKLASTHQHAALQVLGIDSIDEDPGGKFKGLSVEQRVIVSDHFEKAANYYYAHAQAVAKDDIEAYADSLWRSADCFDKAGLHAEAIKKFEEYAKTRPEDPRQLQVMFRLAQAYQAEGQFDAAINLYTTLNENNPKSPEAYASLVPLARCYLAQGVEGWQQAEHVLRSVVTDHEALRPESREYREALIELGRLYYRRGEEGDYERAIERLGEAVARYSDESRLPGILFQLADAYRKSVAQIDQKLASPLSPSQRTEFQAERARRLAAAQAAFGRVIEMYERREAKKLDDLQRLYLRNSYFYRADCAYDLGKYEGPDGAIALYDRAAKRYEKDPSSLVAMIQIVNSYCELGRYDLARTANRRAKAYLEQIPEEAFDDPNLPMGREHWQRWLDWTSELNLAGRTADANP